MDGSPSRARPSARHACRSRMAAARSPGPLRAFFQRVAAKRGKPIAAVAAARKLAMITWHMLRKGED